MTEPEKLAEKIVDAIIQGWNEHSRKFTSRVDAERYWTKKIKDTNCWLDAEKERPKAKQEIIFIDAVGMYKGTFSATKSGQVLVEGKGNNS